MINNRGDNEEEEQGYRFTPKKVLLYCIIVGLISGTFSIFVNLLILLSVAAFVFASITVWYMLGEKFHGWKETRRDRSKIEHVLSNLFQHLKQQIRSSKVKR